jgi:hypothetical protein
MLRCTIVVQGVLQRACLLFLALWAALGAAAPSKPRVSAWISPSTISAGATSRIMVYGEAATPFGKPLTLRIERQDLDGIWVRTRVNLNDRGRLHDILADDAIHSGALTLWAGGPSRVNFRLVADDPRIDPSAVISVMVSPRNLPIGHVRRVKSSVFTAPGVSDPVLCEHPMFRPHKGEKCAANLMSLGRDVRKF